MYLEKIYSYIFCRNIIEIGIYVWRENGIKKLVLKCIIYVYLILVIFFLILGDVFVIEYEGLVLYLCWVFCEWCFSSNSSCIMWIYFLWRMFFNMV